MIDVFVSFRRNRRHDARYLREESVVLRGMGLASTLPFRQMPQLHAQNRRLHFIEAAVPARLAAHIFSSLSVIPQCSEVHRQICRICFHPPGVAVSAQVLCWVKAEAPCIAM